MVQVRKEHAQIGAFVLVHVTTTALYVGSLGADVFSTGAVEVAYEWGGAYAYTEEWGLLGTRVPVAGGVAQAFAQRPNVESFAYAECGSVALPAECDAVRAAGVGVLILQLWAVVAALATCALALHYRAQRQGPLAWLLLALFSLIEAALGLAACLVWLRAAHPRLRDLLRRLFLYDAAALAPADLPLLRLAPPQPAHSLWLALAAFLLSLLSLPLLYAIRRAFLRSPHPDADADAHPHLRLPHDDPFASAGPSRTPDLLSNPVLARIAAADSQWSPVHDVAAADDVVFNIYPNDDGDDANVPLDVYANTGYSQGQSIGQSGTFRYNPPEIMNVKALRAMNADQVSIWFDSMGLGDESVSLILRHDVSGRILLGAPPDSIRSAFGADADIILETLERVRSTPEY